jgi:hypothetical protein
MSSPPPAPRPDVLVLCGGETTTVCPRGRVLARELGRRALRIPAVGVFGNHDYESGQQDEVAQILGRPVVILTGTASRSRASESPAWKALGGGFGERALQPWGEDIMKRFVRETVDEALKLESALARLRTTQRVAVLHYSPIQGTVEGEPPELYPFLGSSRLEEPLNRYEVAAVFHGHAHRGRPEARTRAGVPVYNVCLPLLRELYPDRPPVRIVDLAAPSAPPAPADRAEDARAEEARNSRLPSQVERPHRTARPTACELAGEPAGREFEHQRAAADELE